MSFFQVFDETVAECRKIAQQRQEKYGDPFSNFFRISERWDQWLTEGEASPAYVAMLMAETKLARESNERQDDNLLDAINYLIIYRYLMKRESEYDGKSGQYPIGTEAAESLGELEV